MATGDQQHATDVALQWSADVAAAVARQEAAIAAADALDAALAAVDPMAVWNELADTLASGTADAEDVATCAIEAGREQARMLIVLLARKNDQQPALAAPPA